MGIHALDEDVCQKPQAKTEQHRGVSSPIWKGNLSTGTRNSVCHPGKEFWLSPPNGNVEIGYPDSVQKACLPASREPREFRRQSGLTFFDELEILLESIRFFHCSVSSSYGLRPFLFGLQMGRLHVN